MTNNTLMIINKYLLKHDLFDQIISVGGNSSYCKVKMNNGLEMYRFIDKVKKYAKVICHLTLDKKADQGIIIFKKGNN